MTPPLLGIRSTAVYLDGILMMYLDEAEMDASRGLGPYLVTKSGVPCSMDSWLCVAAV